MSIYPRGLSDSRRVACGIVVLLAVAWGSAARAQPTEEPAAEAETEAPEGIELTPDEIRALLDLELAAALERFDRLMLDEQGRLAGKRLAGPSRDGGRGGVGAESEGGSAGAEGMTGEGTSGEGTSGESTAGQGTSGQGPDGTGATGEQGGDPEGDGTGEASSDSSGGGGGIRSDGRESSGARGAPGSGEGGASGGVPSDIPDGGDDDIVARQLREAAMQEEDPELRERLWEEYRRYKSGSRAPKSRSQDEDQSPHKDPGDDS